MLALCAYYEGTVPEGDRARFDAHVKRVHLPLVAKYPGLCALRYHKGVPFAGEPPRYVLAFELYFESQAALDRAMASPERDAARADVADFAPLFEGTIRHVLYEVEEIPAAG